MRVTLLPQQIRIANTASLRDAFCNELVKLSPPELTSIDFRGSSNLRNFVMSPMESCPKVANLVLSDCSSLDYVMVQSQSLRSLELKGCQHLNKVQQAWQQQKGRSTSVKEHNCRGVIAAFGAL